MTALEALYNLKAATKAVVETMNLNTTVVHCSCCGMIKKTSIDDFNANKEIEAMHDRALRYIRKIESGDWHGRDRQGNYDPVTAGSVRRRNNGQY